MTKKTKLSKIRNQTLKTNGRNHVPLPTGKYQKIGCRDLMVGLSRKNGIFVRLYYPAKIDRNEPEEMNPLLWINWLPHKYYFQGFIDVLNIRSNFVLNMIVRKLGKSSKNLFMPAIPNAKLHMLNDGQKYPVVIFSHGLASCRTSYSAICIELASHGFIVAALEHRDNSACLTFYPKRATYSFQNSNPEFFNISVGERDSEDERDFGDELNDPNYVPPKPLTELTTLPYLEFAWIRYRHADVYQTGKNFLAFRNKQVHHRARECKHAVDLIENLNAGCEINNLLDPGYNCREFENMLDVNRIIVMGHSFGGATALLAGAIDKRIKVVISLDPWFFPVKEEPLSQISQPSFLIFSDFLATSPNIDTAEEWFKIAQSNERKAIAIKKSNHIQQSDGAFVLKKINKILPFRAYRNRMNSFIVHDLTISLSLQFISKHLDIPITDYAKRYVEEQKKRIRPLLNSCLVDSFLQ